MSDVTSILDRCDDLAFSVFGAEPELRTRDVATYLAHCAGGVSMRAIARAVGKEPSTILRAVRRVETLRDDPLADRALAGLEQAIGGASHSNVKIRNDRMQRTTADTPTREELTALQRLEEPESFLLVAKGAQKAGVFCRKNQFRRPLVMIEVGAATRMLAQDWVHCTSSSEMSSKYAITAAGRSFVRRKGGRGPKARDNGFAEAPSIFATQHQLAGERRVANPKTGEIETIRVNLGESPLGWLAKRRDANGEPLLSPDEVEAGERLREDYEMAQIGPKMGQDWRRFLTPVSTSSGPGRTPSEGPMFARDRVAKALEVLGPGLSDAAIRICCFLEGLEATERRMGWSARSGKVVLKLALQRLVEHYGLAAGRDRAA